MLNFKKCCAAALALIALSLRVGSALADEAVLTPVQAIVLPSDGSGLTKIALKYDLSGLRAGDGRRIDAALLDWPLAGVSSSHDSEFAAYAAAVAWTEANAAGSGVGQIGNDAVPASEWEFTTADYERNDGGLVRFNLRELAAGWADGSLANLGIVVTTADVSRANAIASLAGAQLTVRYGFAD